MGHGTETKPSGPTAPTVALRADSDYLASPMTCGEVLRKAATLWPRSELAFPADRLTYADLDARSDWIAKCLLAAGVERGDNVGLLAPPSLEMVSTMFAINKVGATAVLISDRYKALELAHVVQDADLTLLLLAGSQLSPRTDFLGLVIAGLPSLELSPDGSAAVESAARLRHILDIGVEGSALRSVASFGEEAHEISDARLLHLQRNVSVAEIAYIMYTSGTTAMPKGCMMTHEAVTRQADCAARTRYRMDSSSVFWSPLQLFHIAGISPMLSSISVGATFCHVGRFDATVALEQLERERCTHTIPGFEATWLPVINHPDFSSERVASLRMILTAGTPDYLRRLEKAIPQVTVLSNYGSTESVGSIAIPDLDDSLAERTDTCGTPLPGVDIIVCDLESGELCGTEVVGELRFRGPLRFAGYYGDAGETAAAIDADGWVHSGDLGMIDQDGRVRFRGRLKDLIKVGGERVASVEVESMLMQHPAVNTVAVVGVPDVKYNEVVAAFVELHPDAELDDNELIDFCVGKIATYKIPRHVRFMSPGAWPMSGTKVRKPVLREQITTELSSSRR